MLCGRWLGLWLVLTEHSIQPLHCKNCFAFGLLETTPDDSLTLLLKKLHVCRSFCHAFVFFRPSLHNVAMVSVIMGRGLKVGLSRVWCALFRIVFAGREARRNSRFNSAPSARSDAMGCFQSCMSKDEPDSQVQNGTVRVWTLVALKCIGSSVFFCIGDDS